MNCRPQRHHRDNVFRKTKIRGKRDSPLPRGAPIEAGSGALGRRAEPKKRKSKLFRLQPFEIPRNAQESVF
jgi:hypothetical protein